MKKKKNTDDGVTETRLKTGRDRSIWERWRPIIVCKIVVAVYWDNNNELHVIRGPFSRKMSMRRLRQKKLFVPWPSLNFESRCQPCGAAKYALISSQNMWCFVSKAIAATISGRVPYTVITFPRSSANNCCASHMCCMCDSAKDTTMISQAGASVHPSFGVCGVWLELKIAWHGYRRTKL